MLSPNEWYEIELDNLMIRFAEYKEEYKKYNSKKKMKSPKILFLDLDGTLIEPVSGKTFPQGIWDMQFKFDVLDKIKDIMPEFIFIVTNQGGIGRFVTEEFFESKLDYITDAIHDYVRSNMLRKIDSIYCPSEDREDPMRKPNTGMFEHLCDLYGLLQDYNKSDMMMVGDASGLPGNFSDSDKKAADNFGIKYVDVNDFVKIMFE